MLQDIRYNMEKQKGMTDLQLRLSQMEEKAEKLRKMGLLFFCLLLFDIASMGAGKYLPLGWFSFRILLTILVLCCGLPLIFIRFRSLIRKPVSLLLLALLVYLGMETLRGLLLDNSRAVLLSDVKGFAWLGLIPLLQVLIKDRSDLRRAVNFGLAGASFQAAVCVLFNILFTGLIPRSLPSFVEWIWKIQWGTILQVEYNAVRIFCRSSMYLVVACVILWGRSMRSEKLSLKYALLFLLNFFALFYTYTRSMYLTLLAGLLLAFVYTCLKYPLKRVLMRSLILAGVFLILSVFSDIVLRQGSFQYAVARCFHRDLQQMLHLPATWDVQAPVDMEEITENTNNTRALTLEAFRQGIGASPLIGHGLGAVNAYRQDIDEYFYHDMLLRCGGIGLLLYLAPAGGVFLLIWKRRDTLKEDREIVFYGIALICFLIATYYNPWMNAAIGISWYAVCIRGASLLQEAENE